MWQVEKSKNQHLPFFIWRPSRSRRAITENSNVLPLSQWPLAVETTAGA